MVTTKNEKKNNGANVGYEAELWQMADALRGSMGAVLADGSMLPNVSDEGEILKSLIAADLVD